MLLELPWKIITTLYLCREFNHPVDHPPLWMSQPNPVLMLNLAGTGILYTKEEPSEYEVDANERNLFYLHAGLFRYVQVTGNRAMRIIAFAFNIELENGPDFFNYYTIPLTFPLDTRLALSKAVLAVNSLCDDNSVAASFERQRQMQIISGRLQELAVFRNETALPTTTVRCAPAAAELNRHYADPIDIDRLAQLCAVSRPHFFRLFHQEYGMTPQAYLLRKRLKEAQRLLLFTDQTISEVAWKSGWNDPFHFSRLFSREIGCSPSLYRKMHFEH